MSLFRKLFVIHRICGHSCMQSLCKVGYAQSACFFRPNTRKHLFHVRYFPLFIWDDWVEWSVVYGELPSTIIRLTTSPIYFCSLSKSSLDFDVGMKVRFDMSLTAWKSITPGLILRTFFMMIAQWLDDSDSEGCFDIFKYTYCRGSMWLSDVTIRSITSLTIWLDKINTKFYFLNR